MLMPDDGVEKLFFSKKIIVDKSFIITILKIKPVS